VLAGNLRRSCVTGEDRDLARQGGEPPWRASGRAEWADHFYQLANRIAHLHFLRSEGVPAWLALVNFTGDADMGGPQTAEAWLADYEVAFHVMGLPRQHALSAYIIHAAVPIQPG
jgi:hypothetical protein